MAQNGFAESFLVGDSDFDGTVNATDLNALALNWRQASNDWTGGNFEGAGVNAADLNALALNWQRTISVAAASQAVPEPATGVSLASLVGFVLLWCRRKRH